VIRKSSGAPGFVTVRVGENRDGSFTGSVNMPAPGKIETRALPGAGKHPVVSFDGISHIILEEPILKEDAEVLAGEWCRALGADAVGLMFLDRAQDTLTPLVYVPSAGTLFWENSCASGTTAVGAYLAAESGKHVVKALRQPGGELTVDAYPDGALTITGTVRLQRSVSCLLNLML
jgi:diaminopimelate epimerase